MRYEEPSMDIELLEPVNTLYISDESGGNDTTITNLNQTTDDGTLQ